MHAGKGNWEFKVQYALLVSSKVGQYNSFPRLGVALLNPHVLFTHLHIDAAGTV